MHDPPRRREARLPIYELLKDKHWMTWLPKQTRDNFWKSCKDIVFVISPLLFIEFTLYTFLLLEMGKHVHVLLFCICLFIICLVTLVFMPPGLKYIDVVIIH